MKKKGFLSLVVGQLVTAAVIYAIKHPKETKQFANKVRDKAIDLYDQINDFLTPVVETVEEKAEEVVSHKRKYNTKKEE